MKLIWMAMLELSKDSDTVSPSPPDEKSNEYGIITAGEQDGNWVVCWEREGKSLIWYEGTMWVEMRAALRRGMASLLSAGYRLSLGFSPEANMHERRMRERQEWITCYADLHHPSPLYEQLAKWRRETAGKLKRAPYWIATNRMLRIVSAFVPHTPEELKQLPGFGDAKVASYAEDILEVTRTMERKTTFPLDWVQAAVTEAEFAKWIYEQEEDKQAAELLKITERRRLLEGVQLGERIEQLMTRLQVDRREIIVRIEAMEQEGFNMQELIERELVDLPQDERSAIEHALSDLGDKYLRPVLVRAYGEMALEKPMVELQPIYERIRLLRLVRREHNGQSEKSEQGGDARKIA
ncbi:HRDC domain-containing protein [Paenibacillus sp. 481]|uniref:HRDC domain-containing protein n=1 Tax=Paenibacillus sp. 481 TaxID=2835869 RepID=UPI001E302394|nr:HRDC domain-containing protein [Paenibacillus sp. 481]UHA72338.1 HRDC domain-containing protein [Paenibacillus sp. 481]